MNKTIHYCWFGQKPLPEKLQQCLASWSELMPGWEIKRWDETTFDVYSTMWTQGAYDAEKYAFVSDYVRLLALYEEGGLYLDTDVKLIKNMEHLFADYDAFTCFENHQYVTSAVIAAPKHHPLIKKFLEFYQNQKFSSQIVSENEANVKMMTSVLCQYGLILNDSEQNILTRDVNGAMHRFHIFPQTYFCPLDFWHNKNFSENTHAIHLFEASWLDRDTHVRIMKERSNAYKIKIKLLHYLKSFISRIFV